MAYLEQPHDSDRRRRSLGGQSPLENASISHQLALSVVAPAGDRIRSGLKRLEIRQWAPDLPLPLRDLLIVQNRHHLSRAERPEDPEGTAVALIDVVAVRPWREDEIDPAYASYWEPGWLAWELVNVRPVNYAQALPARLRLYSIRLDTPLVYP